MNVFLSSFNEGVSVCCNVTVKVPSLSFNPELFVARILDHVILSLYKTTFGTGLPPRDVHSMIKGTASNPYRTS